MLGRRFSDVFVAAEDDGSGRRNLPFVLTKRAAFDGMILRPARFTDDAAAHPGVIAKGRKKIVSPMENRTTPIAATISM